MAGGVLPNYDIPFAMPALTATELLRDGKPPRGQGRY